MFDIIKIASANICDDRSAAGALEYALLVSFIAVAVIAGVTAFGTNLGTFFTNAATTVAGLAT